MQAVLRRRGVLVVAYIHVDCLVIWMPLILPLLLPMKFSCLLRRAQS
jgi:hypothetical protein